MEEDDLEEDPQGTDSPSNQDDVTVQPAVQEEPAAVVSDHLEGQDPLESDASSGNSFTTEAMDAGYTIVEAMHDIAEEELSEGWGWFGAGTSDEPIVTTSAPPTSNSNTTTKVEKRRRKRQRKRRGKKKKVRKTSPVVGGHVEWTHLVVRLNRPLQ